jgi:acetyltransferase-like isoleucine patch superfamily enzyme
VEIGVTFIVKFLSYLQMDKLFYGCVRLIYEIKVSRYRRLCGVDFKFIPQGDFSLNIEGDISRFKIDETSHLKGGAYLQCAGGISIGKYFHCGKGLTIFSVKHVWKNADLIPYEKAFKEDPVIIGDCVWAGANVTILPGTSIGNGVIIGAGAVVRGEIPAGAILVGNPAQCIGFRDMIHFEKLYAEEKFF